MKNEQQVMPSNAIGLSLFAFFCFSLLDASAKWLVVAGQAVIFVVWVRFAMQALYLVIFYQGWKNIKLWRVQRPVLQVVRGVLLPAMTVLNFLSLQYLQLAQTISILLASPILVAALAGPLLGEWAGPRRWLAILTGFIGVLIVVRPGTAVFDWPIIFIIAAVFCYSFYFILTRKLAGIETSESLIFYSCLFGATILAPFAFSQAQMPARISDWIAFAIAGFSGMIGHMAIIRASTLVDVSKVTPFIYSQIFWMVGLGFVLFGDLPDIWTLTGMSVIALSGFYLWRRERYLRKKEHAGNHYK